MYVQRITAPPFSYSLSHSIFLRPLDVFIFYCGAIPGQRIVLLRDAFPSYGLNSLLATSESVSF